MIFALGSNSNGQLGIGHVDDTATPSRVLLPSSVQRSHLTKLAAGGNHTLLLFENGQIVALGEDSEGKTLPSLTRENAANGILNHKGSTLRRLDPNGAICHDIAATWGTSAAVLGSTAGKEVGRSSGTSHLNAQHILTGGAGLKGELGRPRAPYLDDTIEAARNFPGSWKVIDFAGGLNHFVVVLSTGEVYGWGAGRKGQLGEPRQSIVDQPRKIAGIPFKPERVVCGKEFTYIVGSPTAGEHIVLGDDKWNIVSQAPEKVPEWNNIAATWGSLFVVLEGGRVLSWGRNDHGQLCPPGIPFVKQLTAGSEHVVALDQNGDVITWGWGEHGNCGSPVDEHGDVKGRWNPLPVVGQVDRLGAGCATTFISTIDAGESL